MQVGGEVLSFLLIAMLLFSCVPAYINTYVSWRNQEVSSQETLAATSEIDQDSIIWTDVGDISGTVSKYYYPGVKCRLVDLDVLPDFEEGKTNWIFSSSKLDVSTFKKGYDLEEIVNGGILGTHWIYVYRLGI